MVRARKALWVVALLGIMPGVSRPAAAIPAFARKYQTSCSTCHTVYPVLNSFGKAFRANGYRIPGGDENFTKDQPINLGAPAWQKVWPNSIWPSDIPGHSVAAFWLSSRYRVNKSATITNEFDGINEIYVLAGGTLGKSFSFFSEVEIIDGGTVPTSFGAAVPRAFVQYNHPSHKFNVTYGLFEPRAVLTSTRLRMSRLSDYLSNRYGMPPTANSFSLAPNQRGLEVWGNLEGPGGKGGLEWFGGVVNGRDAGTPPGADAYGAEISGLNTRFQAALAREGRTNVEVNSDKDFYAGANYKIGGMGVLGGGRPEGALVQADNFVDNSVTLGAFYYGGIFPALVTEEGREILDRDGNTFHRAGVKVDANLHKGNLLYGFQQNRDRVRNAGRDFEQRINLVEARYVVYPWLIPMARFEHLKPSYGIAFNRTTVHTSIVIRANIRLSLEGVLSRNSTTHPTRDYRRYDGGNDTQFHARVDFAF